MKHIGQFLKKSIEERSLVKATIAESAGISANYLSTIFKQQSMDAELLEKLCVAIGIHPAEVFDMPENITKSYSDILAKTFFGNASVRIGSNENTRQLLEEKERVIQEKERTIQILMAASNISVPGQERDKND